MSEEIWYFPCHAKKTFPIWFWFMEMRSIGPKDPTGSGLNRSRGGLQTLVGTCHVLSFQSRNTWKIELGVREQDDMCVAASLEGIPWYSGRSSHFVFCYLPPSWAFNHASPISINLGWTRFAEIVQNCVVRQVFGRMCLIFFLAFTLKLPIQNLLSVASTQSVFWCATQFQQNEHTPEFFSILLFNF